MTSLWIFANANKIIEIDTVIEGLDNTELVKQSLAFILSIVGLNR